MRTTAPSRSVRDVVLALALPVLCWSWLLLGCAHQGDGPYASAKATVLVNRHDPSKAAIREAIGQAEKMARRKLFEHIMQIQLEDGRSLDIISLQDPFIRSVVEDRIHNAQMITDRAITEEGLVTVTIRTDLEPIYEIIHNYPNDKQSDPSGERDM